MFLSGRHRISCVDLLIHQTTQQHYPRLVTSILQLLDWVSKYRHLAVGLQRVHYSKSKILDATTNLKDNLVIFFCLYILNHWWIDCLMRRSLRNGCDTVLTQSCPLKPGAADGTTLTALYELVQDLHVSLLPCLLITRMHIHKLPYMHICIR